MTIESLLESLSTSEEFTEFLCRYGSLYGAKIILIATLSAITIYRREMSCNHCYVATEEDAGGPSVESECLASGLDGTPVDWNDEKAEVLLEGVGTYCSGAALLPVVMHIVELLHFEESAFPSPPADFSAEDVLDRAGYFCSGQPLASSFYTKVGAAVAVVANKAASIKQTSFPDVLPVDLHVRIASFLHPKDVVTLSCVNKSCSRLISAEPSSTAIWKSLWRRDYSWILDSWSPGLEAARRSGATASFTKDFYFRFALCYMDYVLAGQNRHDSCLVGLNGHIYDMTPFLASHPGSPETVMVHAGRDATEFFRTVGHSNGARRLAQSLCVCVDLSRTGSTQCGARPTSHLQLGDKSANSSVESPVIQLSLDSKPKVGTLSRIHAEYHHGQATSRRRAERHCPSETNIMGVVNVYYDPLLREFRGWYTNTNLETVFINKL